MKRDHEDDSDEEFLMLTKKKKKDTGLVLDEEDVTEADFEDGYDSDLFGDEADEQYLNSLLEFDREMILLERYEKREELKRLREEAIRSGKLKPTTQEKFKEKKNSKRTSALSDIRAKRQAKKQEPTKKNNKSSSSSSQTSIYGSSGSGSDNYRKQRNEEYENKYNEEVEDEEDEEEKKITIEDLQKITLSRRRLEKWVNEPFFEKTVLNCFVRVVIGENNGIRVYRFCEITGFKEKSLYQIETISTTKYLILRQGGKEKTFPIRLISNSNFTSSEFNSWLKSAKESNDYIPREIDIKKKIEEFEKSNEYAYTEEDINKRLEEKKKLGKQIPGQNLAVEKLKLCTLRDEYFDNGKMKEYEDICIEIEKIENILKKKENKKSNLSSIDISKITNNSSTSTAAAILLGSNSLGNSNLSSKILKALKDDDDEDEFGLKKKKDKYDAFSRRPTRSTGMYVQDSPIKIDLGSPSTKQSSGSGLMSPTSAGGGSNPLESPASHLHKVHDFDLVLDFDQQNFQQKKVQKNLNFISNQNESKKSISIEEYKRRKGI